MIQVEKGYQCYELRAVDAGIFRLRIGFLGEFHDSLLSRYHILHEQGDAEQAQSCDGEKYTLLSTAGQSAVLDLAASEVTFSAASSR